MSGAVARQRLLEVNKRETSNAPAYLGQRWAQALEWLTPDVCIHRDAHEIGGSCVEVEQSDVDIRRR